MLLVTPMDGVVFLAVGLGELLSAHLESLMGTPQAATDR